MVVKFSLAKILPVIEYLVWQESCEPEHEYLLLQEFRNSVSTGKIFDFVK
jgi:hypothetical protein